MLIIIVIIITINSIPIYGILHGKFIATQETKFFESEYLGKCKPSGHRTCKGRLIPTGNKLINEC